MAKVTMKTDKRTGVTTVKVYGVTVYGEPVVVFTNSIALALTSVWQLK